MARAASVTTKSSAKKPAAKAEKPAKAKKAEKLVSKASKVSVAKSATKPATKTATKPKAPAKTTAVAQKKPNGLERQQCVEVAAYYIAERRGFALGDPVQDWLDAEAEVERLLKEGVISL